MYKIEEKVALVTGSTAGLGKELALQLCSGGARVALNGRDPEKLDEIASELREQGFDVFAVQGDVGNPEDCRRVIDQCVEHFGRLDILISNAGISSGGKFTDTNPEIFKRVFDINTLGTIYITRYALPHIQKTGGSIVFISSLAALVGLPYASLYCSSKMALTAIGQSLQVELRGTGVHVGIVYVGFLKNGPDKRVVGPDGNLQPTGSRETVRLQPMDQAGRAIIRVIQKRKRKKVMSLMGKLVHTGLHLAPWLVRLIVIRSKKRARDAYEPRADV
ncbi:MAG: SDR family oxidoreductase [Bacteroidota bacterium]